MFNGSNDIFGVHCVSFFLYSIYPFATCLHLSLSIDVNNTEKISCDAQTEKEERKIL